MTAFIPGLITSLRQVVLVQSTAQRLLGYGINRFHLNSTSCFSTSSPLRGLEEFFPPLTGNPDDLVEESEKAGRPWKKNELRLKSNDELHKLCLGLLKGRGQAKQNQDYCVALEMAGKTKNSYQVAAKLAHRYVLLKERNKLLTLDHEAKRVHVFMPGGERLKKVITSMDKLKQVVNERDRAVKKARRLLESRGVNEDLARVLRVMEYNVNDLPEIVPPPVKKDKRPIIKLVHKKRKL